MATDINQPITLRGLRDFSDYTGEPSTRTYDSTSSKERRKTEGDVPEKRSNFSCSSEHLAISDLEEQQNKDAKIRERVVLALKILAFLLYHGYLIAGIKLTWNETGSYCHDVKFLVVVTAIVYICVIWKIVAYTFDYFLEARWDNLKSNLKESISAKTKRGMSPR